MAEIEIPYKPRNWAKKFHETAKRWIVVIVCRRAGKTTASLNHLQRDCLRIKNSRFAYIAPTYKMAKRIAWDIVKEISGVIPSIKYNEVDLTVIYPNGSKLYLLGSENVDSLRGIALWGVVFDEYAQHPFNLFSEVISKCLADHLGYAIFVGTPKGKGLFYDTYKNAIRNTEQWLTIFKTIDNLLEEEVGETINNLRQALKDERSLVEQGLTTIDEFDQEWYCSFEAALKGAYYASQIAELRKKERIKQVPYDRALKVHIVLDLGIGQAMAAGFYQRVANEIHKIDYWEGEGSDGIPSAVKVFQNKPYIYGKIFVPHDAKGREQSTEKTRMETLQNLWPAMKDNIIVVPKLSVDDGIDKGKLMFSRLWVDKENCQRWIDLISQYKREYDEDKKMFLEKPRHDFTSHAADEYRYAAITENEMTNDEKEKDTSQEPYEPQSEYEGGEESFKRNPVSPSSEELGMM